MLLLPDILVAWDGALKALLSLQNRTPPCSVSQIITSIDCVSQVPSPWGSASESHQEISGQERESGPLTSYTPQPQLQWGHNGCLNPSTKSTSLGSPLLQLSLGPRTNWHLHPFRLLVQALPTPL